jgi:hypothetical protein
MKIKQLVALLFVICCTAWAQEKTQPTVKSTPLSDGFIRPATRAFTTIKESTGLGLVLAKGPTPTDDRISEADTVASTPADKVFVAAMKDYKTRKMVFNALYTAERLDAKLKAENGGEGVPVWECAPLEDHDTCPSFQAAVKSLLAADRDLAKAQDAIEDCEDSLANALKTRTFGNAPACSNKK